MFHRACDNAEDTADRCGLLGSHGGRGCVGAGLGLAARYGKWSMPNSSSLQTAFELYDRAQAEAVAGEFRAFCKYTSPPSLLTEAVRFVASAARPPSLTRLTSAHQLQPRSVKP